MILSSVFFIAAPVLFRCPSAFPLVLCRLKTHVYQKLHHVVGGAGKKHRDPMEDHAYYSLNHGNPPKKAAFSNNGFEQQNAIIRKPARVTFSHESEQVQINTFAQWGAIFSRRISFSNVPRSLSSNRSKTLTVPSTAAQMSFSQSVKLNI